MIRIELILLVGSANSRICKNAKSTLAALIALLLMSSSREPRPELIIAASAQKQATRIYNYMAALARTSKDFEQVAWIRDHLKVMQHRITEATASAVPAEPDSLFGGSPSVVLADELFTWKGERGRRMVATLRTAQGSRKNPLLLWISTAPDEPIAFDDPFSETLAYARAVEIGEIDDRRFMPALWMAGQDEDWTDEKVWNRVNPNLGYSLRIEELREEYERAKTSPALAQSFRTLRLNQLPETSLQRGWLQKHEIDAAASEPIELDEFLDCDRVILGLDLGGREDMSSLAIVGYFAEANTYIVRCVNWLSRTAFDRYASRAPLAHFERDGALIVVEGDQVSHEIVFDEIIGIAGDLNITDIAIDPALSAVIAPRLEEFGLEVSLIRQGAMSFTPILALGEEVFGGGRIKLDKSNEVLAWCFQNAVVEYRGQARMISKREKGESPNKIDAAIATLTALGLFIALDGEESARGDETNWIDPWIYPQSARDVIKDGITVRGWLETREPRSWADGVVEIVE